MKIQNDLLQGFGFFCEMGIRRMANPPVAAPNDPFVPGDWFQLAKTGTFHSPVYGEISISPDDLVTMYRNFKTKTPLAPTQLPIDYDHLSDEPQKPEDGKAAGWVQDLQLRNQGNTLWCLPKWTRRAATMIFNGEYRFVSPYFLVDYLDKVSGQKIGPTLKAVAVTNRPFLEGMQPIPAPSIAASEPRPAGWGSPRLFVPNTEQKGLRSREKRASVVGVARDVACSSCGAPAAVVGIHRKFSEGSRRLDCPRCGSPVRFSA